MYMVLMCHGSFEYLSIAYITKAYT